MSHPLTLDTVQAEFEHWRQQKTSPQSRVPEDLKRKAVELCADYSSNKIIRALKIPPKRFSQWCSVSDNSCVKVPETTFLSVPSAALAASQGQQQLKPLAPSSAIQVTGSHTNGLQWCLQGEFTPEQLHAVVSALGTQSGGTQ